ncbi:hypothetical protein AAFF_G00351750 [Aldrovandia affinis]|uniref:Uncharacterized protein n=1 Tax=Aldrovandia affinis TaxID=143900 RepID=A0AAD7SJ19_9TELE|nr:hypothetical protein AAFF_G00351750 [Aldrovandia affinis]
MRPVIALTDRAQRNRCRPRFWPPLLRHLENSQAFTAERCFDREVKREKKTQGRHVADGLLLPTRPPSPLSRPHVREIGPGDKKTRRRHTSTLVESRVSSCKRFQLRAQRGCEVRGRTERAFGTRVGELIGPGNAECFYQAPAV